MMQWKSVTAVAALATWSALTACGAEGTAARIDSPVVTAPDALAPVAPVTAEALPPAAKAAVESVPKTDEKAGGHVQGPAISPAELRAQILELIRSFQSLEHLERAHVERMLRVQLRRNPGMTEGYDYEVQTTDGWAFSVSVDKLYRLDQPSTILIGLDHGVEPWTDQQPTYCTLEFEPLAKELVAMGYEQGVRAFNRGGDMI